MLVFAKGSDWAENLFRKLFSSEDIRTEVSEKVQILPEDIIFSVENDEQIFNRGIILKTPNLNTVRKKEKEIKHTKDIPLPVVLRIFKKTVPLSEVESIGETSEILLSNSKEVDVDLLINGDVVGKGILRREDEDFRLKITELYI